MDSTQPPEPVPATPATRRCTLYAAAGGVGALALSLATFLTQPRRDEHYALPCLLLAIGALLLAAAFVANGGSFRCSRGTLALGELELGAKLLILGATALDLAMLIVFLAVPLGLAAVYVLCTCYLRCFFYLLCGAPEERWGERHDAFRQLRVARRRAQV